MHGERLLSRNVAGIILISFLVTVGFGAVNLIVPYYILALKGLLVELPEKLGTVRAERAALEIGAMASAFMATRALFAAASGWLSDRVGRKPLIVTGMSLYTVLGILYALTTAEWQLIVLRAVQGVASALVWPVAEALLMDTVAPGLRTRTLSLYIISANVGQVVGPLIGSAAYEASKRLLEGHPVVDIFRAPFILITIATLPAVAVAATLKEAVASTARTASEKAMEMFRGGLRELPSPVKRALTAFYANGLLNGIAMGIMTSIMIVYIIDFIAKEPTKVAAAMSIAGLAGLLVSYPVAHIADKLSDTDRKRLLIASYALARLLLATIGFIRSYPLFIAVAAALSILMNITMPLLRSIQAGLIPSRLRGRVFGLQQAFFNLGMVAGPLIGAYIYRRYYTVEIVAGVTGAQAAFIFAAVLGLAGITLLTLYYNPAAIAKAWTLHRSRSELGAAATAEK
ncbi:MFS transporter [Hyperthermus butylicus]|nr:MFS transporter [Hyperthermus butylicus]